MFSLCISNEKKFNHSTKGVVTVVPVYVEFGSIYSLDSSIPLNTNQKTDADDAGIELLHTVAGLYYKNLANIPLNIIYESLCKEGVKTLLLLRHGEEILKEWKDELRNRKDRTVISEPFLGKKANTDPAIGAIDYCNSSSKLMSPDELMTCSSSVSSGFPSVGKESNGHSMVWSPSVEDQMDISMLTNSSCSKTFSSGIISDLEDECESKIISSETDDLLTATNANNTQYPTSNTYSSSSATEKDNNDLNKSTSDHFDLFCREPETRLKKEPISPPWTQVNSTMPTYRDLEAKIECCFDDHYDEKLTSDDDGSNWSKSTDDRLTELLKSGEKFFNSVNERRNQRNLIKSADQLDLSQVAIEHRIIGSISFHKDYRLPSMPIVFIDWLIVRDSYRHSKIGSYLVKKIKSSSLVGSYHLMCVNSLSSDSTGFFRSLGFISDDISECRLRPLLPKKLISPLVTHLPSSPTLLFYYPSYRVNSVSLFSNDSLWFDVSLKSISEEIDFWRERSIESYHDQITLVLRLKSEIVKLHNQLRQRDKQLKEIKQENKELRHIVTQSNAMAAISTIDELGSLFESIKDLCSVVR